MNKVIAILSEDPFMDTKVKEMKAHYDRIEERKKFIGKQASDLNEAQKKSEDQFEKEIIVRLKELKKLPEDYDPKEDHIAIDFNRDCALWHRHDKDCKHSESFFDFISRTLGRDEP